MSFSLRKLRFVRIPRISSSSKKLNERGEILICSSMKNFLLLNDFSEVRNFGKQIVYRLQQREPIFADA